MSFIRARLLRREAPAKKVMAENFFFWVRTRPRVLASGNNPHAGSDAYPAWSSPMATSSSEQVTELLLAWGQGDESALEQLVPMVYGELHRLAHRYLGGERAGHMLQTTALVNEAYLRLVDSQRVQWQNRAHFFAVSAQLMRRVLVDFARSRNYQKRGGDAVQVSLHEELAGSTERGADLVALDDALNAMAKSDERASRVVELRFFGGLSIEETAEVLKISPETVKRDWTWAKAWLLRELASG
ncbi:MAG: sigma-70 family RNA polymerase sigma factor, partial [Blastocatellia bacterium]